MLFRSQGIIPYGAQMLVALAAASAMGSAVSAFQVIPFLWYPFALLLSSLAFIFFAPSAKDEARAAAEAAGEAAEAELAGAIEAAEK